MAFLAGAIKTRLELDASKFSRGVKTAKRQVKGFGDYVEKNSQKFRQYGRTATIAGAAVVASLGAIIKQASDATEIHNRYATVFADSMDEADKSVKTLVKSYGQSKVAAEEMMGATGDLLTGLGMTAGKATDLSAKTQKLAVDLASFTNIEGGAQRASEALTKAMLGEREQVKLLGIQITENMIKDKLAAEGKEDLTGIALKQAKAEAALSLAYEQSGNAIGDYGRTQDSLANTMRRLKARAQDIIADLGQKLIPIATELAHKVEGLVDKISKWIKEHPKLSGGILKVTGAVGGLMAVLGPLAMVLPTLAKGFGMMGVAMKTALGPIGLIAGAAAVAYVKLSQLIEAQERATDAAYEAEMAQHRLGQKLREAADKAGLTRKEYIQLERAYNGNTAALASAIMKGKEGKKLQEALAEVGEKHRKEIEKQKEANKDLKVEIIGLGTAMKNNAKTIMENVRTKAQLKTELNSLATAINNAKASGDYFDGSLKQMAQDAYTLAQIAGEELSPKILKLAGEWETVSEKLKETPLKEARNLGDVTGKALSKIRIEGQEMGDAMAASFRKVGIEIEEVNEQIEADWIRTVSNIISSTGTLGEKVSQVFSQTGKRAIDTFSQVFVRSGDLVAGLKAGFNTARMEIQNIFESVGGAISSLGEKMGGAFGKAAEGVGGMIGKLGKVGGIVGAIVSILGEIPGAAEDTDKAMSTIFKSLGKIFEPLSEALSSITEAFSESLVSTIDSVMTSLEPVLKIITFISNAIGEVIGFVSKAISAVSNFTSELLSNIPLIGGLFKKGKTEAEKFEESVDSVKDSMSEFGEISDSIAEAIAKDAEEMSNHAAESKHFSDVIKDVGVNQENINDLWSRSAEILDDIESGELSAEEGAEELGESFSSLVDEAQEFGTEGSKAMTDFIKQVQASGTEVKEVTEYVNDQLGVVEGNSMNAAEGLAAMAEGVGNNEKAMKRLEGQTLAVYNAMIENGASASQAMESLGGVLDKISEKHKENGTEASEAIKKLLKVRKVTQEHKGLMSAIEGNLAVLNALGNTGSLNQETLNNAATSAKNYYNQLKEAGLSGKEALSQMGPTLERLRYLSEEQGLELDKNTQKLIKQAEEQGLIEEQQMKTVDVMKAGFGEIIKALGGDIPKAFQTAMDEMEQFGQQGQESMQGIGIAGKKSFDQIRARSEKTSEEFRRKWKEKADTAFGGMVDAGKRAFDSIKGKVSEAGGEFKKSFADGVSGALGEIDRLGKKIKDSDFGAEVTFGTGEGAQAISAQTEGSWYVRAQEQLFRAHRGEQVDIYHAPPPEAGGAVAGRGGGQQIFNLQAKPVIVRQDDGVHVSFVLEKVHQLEKKITKGGVPIPTRSVKGTA